jgi:hypothetical protein
LFTSFRWKKAGAIIEKMRLLGAFVAIVALMAVALMPLDMALAQEVNPDRTLPHTVERGQTFNVIVTFTAPADNFTAIAITDFAPDGWNVTVDKTWCQPQAWVKATSYMAEVAWQGPYDKGVNFTVLYKAVVPPDASLGNYTFSGFLAYYIGPSGHIFENITGDSEVEVGLIATPAISYSPASFNSTQSGANLENMTLEVWNSGGGTLNWSLTDDATWLSENPTGGSSTGADDTTLVTVWVNTTGMSAGDYSASITITAPGVSNSPQTVPVSLHVAEISPSLQAWLSQYWWTIVAGIVVVVLLVYFLRPRRNA